MRPPPQGSEYKVDASYLSPNVNMASRLEAATKQYGVPLLLSQVRGAAAGGASARAPRRALRGLGGPGCHVLSLYLVSGIW